MNDLDLTIAGFDPYKDSDGYVFDIERGQRVIEFGEKYLVHALGRWQNTPFKLTEWQRRLILNLFGWVHAETGLRRFRHLFLTCARKAGKSTLCSLIAWWCLACDDEPSPQVLLCANSAEQARNLWSTITYQMDQWPKSLQAKFVHRRGINRIVSPSRNGYIQMLAAKARNVHGTSPSCVIYDEQSWSTNNDLHTALGSGFGAREQPLFVTCSTVSHETDNAFAESLAHAKKVRDGLVSDPTVLPVIYQMPDEDSEIELNGEKVKVTWHDKRFWHMANPNLDIGLPNDLESEYAKALSMPSYSSEFRMTKLNQVCSSMSVWLPVAEWDKQSHEYPADLSHIPCAIGVDLSTSQDITAFVATWFVDGVLHKRPFFFLPKDNALDRIKSKIPYDVWSAEPEKTGLYLTDGNSVDYPFVTQKILEFAETHNVEAVYFDRHKWSSVISGLMQQGIECVAHGQDFASMNSPAHEFERLVLTHSVNCPNPIMRWMVGHCSVKTNEGGEIKPVKPSHKDYRKIDGIIATLMTLNHHTAIKEKVISFTLPGKGKSDPK